ncbi:hypothetical protein [Enterococcus pallens]|uniref:hypothetical protein n=1 Tax=Enterococcus pallens TaxID=160454 RepID=UPI0003A57A1E|nr:hypothetical protein [Enterococcus pallens]
MEKPKSRHNKYLYIALLSFACALLLAAFTSGIFFKALSFVFFLIFIVTMRLASQKAEDEKTSAE